jgi:NAD-dependent dihydropyrimidine dehydrogenase PreA subunit
MTHIITRLCLRDSACVDVCPVECIIGGQPEDEWPWFYIDPDTCIDCGACIPECPYEAILPEDEVPNDYAMEAGVEYIPHGGARTTAEGGEVFDLTEDTKFNYDFFSAGPGYDAQ